MAYDLTATTNGTIRVLGAKSYIYNSTAARWDRLIPITPDAQIDIIYAGSDTSSRVVTGQIITVTITWNQAVSSSQFTQAMLVFNPSTAASNVTGFTQVSGTTNQFTFKFSFTGALGQFYIPDNSVTINGASNSAIYSPVVPGAYLPYALMSIVQKSTGNSIYTIYSFTDTTYSNATRYVSVTATGTGANNAANRRLLVTFSNGSGSISTTTTFTSSDVARTAVGTNANTFNTLGPYTTVSGTTSSAGTDVNRYLDIYSSSATTNVINKFNIADNAYTDGGTNNVSVSPIYFALLPNTTIGLSMSAYSRTSGSNISRVKFTIDHFTSMLSTADKTKLVPSYGSIGTLTKDTTDPSGTSYYAAYTPASNNYNESFAVAGNAFIMPAGTYNSLNGLTLTTEPAASTYNSFSSSRTNSVQTFSNLFSIVGSFTFANYLPAAGSTISANAKYIYLNPSQLIEYYNPTKRISLYKDNSSANGGTLITSYVVPVPDSITTNYITAVAAGTGTITLQNTTTGTGNLMPAGTIITLPTTWSAGGGLTPGASYYIVSGSGTSYVISATVGGTALTTTTTATASTNNQITVSRYNTALAGPGSQATITAFDNTGVTFSKNNLFTPGQSFTTSSSFSVAYSNLSASTTYYILNGSGYTYTISTSRGGSQLSPQYAVTPSSANTIDYRQQMGINLSSVSLISNTTYYIELDEAAYRDNYGNLNSKTVTSFTTPVIAAMILTPTNPVANGTGAGGALVTLVSDTDIVTTNTVNWYLRQGTSTGTVVASGTMPAPASDKRTVTVSISGYTPLEGTVYYFSVDSGAYSDIWGVLSTATSFSYTTGYSVSANHVVHAPGLGGGTTTYVVPPFQYYISAVVVAKGQGAGADTYCSNGCTIDYLNPKIGGNGGGLTYRNNIPVTPGETLYLLVNGDESSIRRGSTSGTVLVQARSGGYTTPNGGAGLGSMSVLASNSSYAGTIGGGSGGQGGYTSSGSGSDTTYAGGGGGGAGGYTGDGGDGGAGITTGAGVYNSGSAGSGGAGGGGSSGTHTTSAANTSTAGASGGGVGIYGTGSSGTAGTSGSAGGAGSGGTGTTYGGGQGGYSNNTIGSTQGAGVVRILWGTGRSFPSTNVSSSTS